jgi:hypothetical protein
MPRYRRLIAEGSVQHVVSRFVNREFRFDAADARTEYLRRAGIVLTRSDWRAIGFALMSSHVHWAMRAGLRPSSSVIKPLHAGFAGWLNAKQARLGPVFADRHRTLTFDAETAAALLAYIHNNPVRAGVVADPSESSWTSHRAYLGLAPEPPWMDVKLGLALCGFSAAPSGRLAFHEMVVARADEARRIEISGGDMHVRRRTVRAVVQAPVELSTPDVIAIDGDLRVDGDALERTAAATAMRQRAWCGDTRIVLEAVARSTGTDVAALRSFVRTHRVAHARRLALLVWTRELERPAVELARVIGLSSSSASHLIRTASAGTLMTAAALGRDLRGGAPG